MKKEYKELYKKAFEMFLAYNIDFNKYDKIIESSGLDVKKANYKEKNISSNYLIFSNDIYLDNLSKEDIDILKKTNQIDFELLKMVSRTYKEALKSENGSVILFEFKTVSESDYEYKEDFRSVLEQQKDFIARLVEEISQDINNKLAIGCEIFINTVLAN